MSDFLSQFSDFLPSLGLIALGIIIILLANLAWGLFRGGIKRGHANILPIYDDAKNEFKFGSIVLTLFLVGILFSLFSQVIALEFRLNVWAILTFGLFFIIFGFVLIGVKIR